MSSFSSLRPDPHSPDTYTPVPPPRVFISGHLYLGIRTHTGTIAYSTRKLHCLGPDSGSYVICDVDINEPPQFIGDSTHVDVILRDKFLRLEYNGSRWVCAGRYSLPECPPVFEVETSPEISEEVPSRKLSHAYSAGQSLSRSDAAAASADLVDAYTNIANAHSRNGAFFQPALVHYRLLDADGNAFYSSPKILVGSPRLDSAITIKATDTSYTHLAAYQIGAAGYRLKLRIPAQPSLCSAARLEVVTSPQMHVYDNSAPVNCWRVMRPSGLDFVRLALPGADSGELSPSGPGAAELVRRMMPDNPSERVVCVIDSPFASTSDRSIVITPDSESSTSALKRLRKALSVPPKPVAREHAFISAPHSIIPRSVASASGVTMAAGITVRRFPGFPLQVFAVAGEPLPWQACATVSFADGSSVSSTSEGTGDAPTMLSPTISYPAPDATSIHLQLAIEGRPLSTITLPLSPDPEHRRSVYVSPWLRTPQWTSSATSLSIPPDTAPPIRFPSAVAVTSSQCPLSVSAVATTGSSDVLAIAPASKALGAWDFGRARFVCGGAGGIHALTVNSARSAIAVNLLDPRPLTSDKALLEAPDGNISALVGGDLVTISGSSVKNVLHGVAADLLGWLASRREIWCFSSSGAPATVVCPDLKNATFSVPLPLVEDVISTPEGIYLAHADDVSRISDSDVPPPVIPFEATFSIDKPPVGTCRLAIPLSASHFHGTVSVTHSHLPVHTESVAQFSINGAPHSPLLFPLHLRKMNSLTVTISGSASHDLVLHNPSILH